MAHRAVAKGLSLASWIVASTLYDVVPLPAFSLLSLLPGKPVYGARGFATLMSASWVTDPGWIP